MMMEIAQEARSVKYLKNEAWCLVNAVENYGKSKSKKDSQFLFEQLEKALICFKELDHLRGQMQVHRLYADLQERQKTNRDSDKVNYHRQRAKAIAVLVEDDNVRSSIA